MVSSIKNDTVDPPFADRVLASSKYVSFCMHLSLLVVSVQVLLSLTHAAAEATPYRKA